MNDTDTVLVTRAAPGDVSDAAIEGLLRRAYVEGGFTPAEVAKTLFAASAVRARGELLVVRPAQGDELVGMVIVVPPTSPARKLAEADEAEMHLLAVAPEQRGHGVGGALVRAAVASARQAGWARMVLWTQPTMASARKLYEAEGFVRAPARDARIAELTGRTFFVFEKGLVLFP
jgi:ribosomal protein S18 acetylase RimI-like enzyme